MYEHARAHYRLRYPAPERPVFVAGDHGTHDVVDCSERGFRFASRGAAESFAQPGARARGEIRFRSGHVAEVAGVVVRVQDSEVAVHLDQAPIPFGTVVHEQLRLRRLYPFLHKQQAS